MTPYNPSRVERHANAEHIVGDGLHSLDTGGVLGLAKPHASNDHTRDQSNLNCIGKDEEVMPASNHGAPTASLTFDAGAARHLLTSIFLGPKAPRGLIEIDWDVPDATGAWKLNCCARYPNTLEGIEDAIAHAARVTLTRSRVYFGAGLRRPGLPQGKPSTNRDVLAWTALCWDFDDKESAERGLARAKAMGLRFHIVVQTGAIRQNDQPDLRIQCWVLLDEPCYDLGRVSQLLKRGIAALGSDRSVHDARRVMRLAGSVAWARKDGRVDEPTYFPYDLPEPSQ